MRELSVRPGNRILSWLALFMLLAGICVFIYPLLAGLSAEYRQTILISSYDENLKSDENTEQERKAAVLYNQKIAMKQAAESFVYTAADHDPEYFGILSNQDGTMGYLSIPELGLNLPIGHGTSTATLAIEAGHLYGTSLPVGGSSTHAVLAAHSALSTAELFTHLYRIKKDDLFYLHILGEIHVYKVDRIKTVLPGEMKDLQIIKGKDYVTLLTCTPYGINTHRLLVRGERTYDLQAGIKAENMVPADQRMITVKIACIAAAPVMIAAAGFYMLLRKRELE